MRLVSVSLLVVLSLYGLAPTCHYPDALAKVESKGTNTVTPAQENYELALHRYKDKDIDGAIDALLQAIYFSRNYYNPQAYYWLGVCYMAKKQDAKAIEALNKHCEQVIGSTPEAHLHLAEIYLRNDRLDEAEREASLALIQYQGPGPKAHNVLGLIKQKRGDLNGAQYEFSQALGDPPWRYTDAWMNYAENLMKQKDWGGAIIQFRNMAHNKIILAGLDYEKVFLNIGLCLLAKGDHQGAIDNWHECLNYNPENPSAHLQLAMLFDVEQHFASAIKEYQEFVRLSDDKKAIVDAKERIHILELKNAPKEEEPMAEGTSPNIERQESAKQPVKQKENTTPTTVPKESGF